MALWAKFVPFLNENDANDIRTTYSNIYAVNLFQKQPRQFFSRAIFEGNIPTIMWFLSSAESSLKPAF
jgi:hypothetical protein